MDFEQAYSELQRLYSTSNRVPGFRRKVMVEADQFARVISQLRTAMPADVQEAQEILRQKDSILNQAYLEAQRVKATVEEEVAAQKKATEEEHQAAVSDSTVLAAAEERAAEMAEQAMGEAEDMIQDAQRRAYRIVSEAEDIAASRREGADQYASEVLFSLEEQMSEILGQIRRGIDTLRPDVTATAPGGGADATLTGNNFHVQIN